jgi:hypothetical protein
MDLRGGSARVAAQGTQAPFEQWRPPLHAPSSKTPLQLSSRPLHVSAKGQCSGLPHFFCPSSMVPSQLLSRLSQASYGS